MSITSIEIKPKRDTYGILEVLDFVITVERSTSGGGETVTLELKKELPDAIDETEDTVLLTEQIFLETSGKITEGRIDLKKSRKQRQFSQYIDNENTYKLMKPFGNYYLTITDGTTSFGDRDNGNFELVPISVFEFRKNYLIERGLINSIENGTPLDRCNLDNLFKNLWDDESIERALDIALSETEGSLDIRIEPTRTIMRPDLEGIGIPELKGINLGIIPDGYDEVVPAVDFDKKNSRNWGSIKMPRTPLLEIERIWGVYFNKPVVEYPKEWARFGKIGGLVNIIPTGGTTVNVHPVIGALPIYNYAYRPGWIPAFWAFVFTHGLTGSEKEYPEVIKCIAHYAMLDLLTFVGSADKPGISSESKNTGGTSESISYTQSAVYSLFSSDVELVKKSLPKRIMKLRQRLKGVRIGYV